MIDSDPILNRVRGAVALRRDGFPAEAETLLSRLTEDPSGGARARVEAWLELGKARDLLGRRSKAQACYRRVLALTDDWRYREQARALFRKPYVGR